MNFYTSNLFDAIYGSFVGFEQPFRKDFRFIIETTPTPDVQTLRSGVMGYKLTQEYPVIENWYEVTDLVITTASLPVNKEGIAFTYSDITRASSVQLSIITDFIPIVDKPGDNKNRYLYNAISYRYIDLSSTSSINKIDYQVYWVDKLGILYEIYVNPRANMSVKFLFRKKAYLT